MRKKLIYRTLLVICLLVAAGLSCQSIIPKQVREVLEVKDTAVAFATEIDIGAIVTEFEAITTEIDMGAMVTEVGAFITEIPDLSGEKPEDIPVMEGSDELLASAELIEFFTDASLQEVVDFYEREMPPLGWTKVSGEVKEDEAELVFEKAGRKATISIADIFISVSVTITIEAG